MNPVDQPQGDAERGIPASAPSTASVFSPQEGGEDVKLHLMHHDPSAADDAQCLSQRSQADRDAAHMADAALQKQEELNTYEIQGMTERSDPPVRTDLPEDLSLSTPNASEDKPKRGSLGGLFSRANLRVAFVPFVCGCTNGYTIGFVAPYTQLYKSSTNCAAFTTRTGCEAVPFADCYWTSTPGPVGDSGASSSPLSYCGWRRITCRAAYPNDAWMGGGGDTALARQNCLLDSQCTWSYSAAECQNPTGYSVSYTGLFAGSIIAGSMIGAIFGGHIVTSLGTRLTFLMCGLMCVVCSVMGHVEAATDEFWVLVVERFVIGIFMGLITVACPLYVNTNADPLYRRKLGTLFQVFTTFGVLIASIIGLGVGQTIDYDAERDANLSGRIHGLAAGQTAFSFAMIALGLFSSENKVTYNKQNGGLNQSEYGLTDMIGPLLMSVVLNGTMRFTGFNSLLNYAPSIMSSLGLAPLVGNIVMTICNFVGTVVSIPLDSFFSIRHIFLFGSCFISCICLFLCGVPMYPGVAATSVMNGCSIAGVAIFIFAYEVFIGPSFYILCQEIFPPSFRPRGNSFAQLWQFVFNLVINVCYPIAVESFSGGPSGNQRKGQSIIFIFFGGVGLICFVLEMLFLKTWKEEVKRESEEAAATEEPAEDASVTGNSLDTPAEELPRER